MRPSYAPVDTGPFIGDPAPDASARANHGRHVAAAAREGPLDLMRRAREGADHRTREDTLGSDAEGVSLC